MNSTQRRRAVRKAIADGNVERAGEILIGIFNAWETRTQPKGTLEERYALWLKEIPGYQLDVLDNHLNSGKYDAYYWNQYMGEAVRNEVSARLEVTLLVK